MTPAVSHAGNPVLAIHNTQSQLLRRIWWEFLDANVILHGHIAHMS